MTATCRPQTWIQRISGDGKVPLPWMTVIWESDLHEPPSSVEEEVPENLGHEWRVLHPFELPGVRHPIDATPPNQRRQAENDALVELIQTIEYLEDIPMWGQEIISSILLGMVTLSIEEEEEVEEGVEEEEK